MSDAPGKLHGKSILVVEEEYMLAMHVADFLRAQGATIIGPAASVPAAMVLVEGTNSLDAAVLDVNLRNDRVYPVADALLARGVFRDRIRGAAAPTVVPGNSPLPQALRSGGARGSAAEADGIDEEGAQRRYGRCRRRARRGTLLELVALSRTLSMLLDRFRFLLVQLGQLVVGMPVGMEQFVQLAMNRLGVPMFGTLDEQRHQPGREDGDTVPFKGFAVEPPPQEPVGGDDGEGKRPGRDHANLGQETPNCLHEP